MKLQNPFPYKVRKCFIDCWECWACSGNGQNCGGLELHHIVGRESKSILNAAVLCKDCHDKIGHGDTEQATLLQKTIKYLLWQGYDLTLEDINFYEKYKRLYDKGI